MQPASRSPSAGASSSRRTRSATGPLIPACPRLPTPKQSLPFVHASEQASHGGELAAGVLAGVVTRDRVTDIGLVLAGEADGRRSAHDITLFDSTGLAIQDLAIAKVAAAKAGDLDLPTLAI